MATFEHIFQVMLKGVGPDGVVRNVFHYTPVASVLNANDAAKALGDQFASAAVLTPIKVMITNAVTFTQIRVTELGDMDVLYDLTISVPGTNSGSEAAPFIAVGFAAAQPAVGVHRAEKRFGPIAAGSLGADGSVESNATELNAIAAMLNAPVHTDDDGLFVSDWKLVLVKRLLVSVGPPRAYALPGPGDFPAVAYPTVGWDWKHKATTQNTRKFGRGE